MTPQRPLIATLALFLALSLAAACAPYRVSTPDGMIALTESSHSVYAYRATTPEGVVVAARQIRMRDGTDVPVADLEFWLEATKLRLRTVAAYALIDEDEVTDATGTPGVRLSFGRDDGGQTYRYDVALFVTDRFVHVIEAGGEDGLFEAAEASIDASFASYTVRR